jgi:hypothetical protein
MTAKNTRSFGARIGAINPSNVKIPTISTSPNNPHIENAGIHLLNGLIRTVNEIAHAPGQVGHIIDKVGGAAVKYALSSSSKETSAKADAAAKAREKGMAQNFTTKVGNGGSGANGAQKFTPPPLNPSGDYRFNLPPHQWSLPLDPDAVSPETVAARSDDYHTTRRGRIWYYNGYVGPTSAPDYQNTGIYTPPAGSKGTSNKYGFQFIWNPETFSQNTAVNMSITPSAADPTIALTGFAAANSTMSFTLRLDRTNDFACAKNFVFHDSTFTVPGSQTKVNQGNFKDVAKYYNFGSKYVDGFTVEDDIKNLLTYGTEADLEFLYRTINGTGWKGIGGRETSNIGYLMPSLIRLDLGNQKFVGVVSDIQVNHLAFTRDLVPIRTDVNITVDLRANIQPTTNNGAVGR